MLGARLRFCAVFLASSISNFAWKPSLAGSQQDLFVIDSSQSKLFLSGEVLGVQIAEQGPGSLVAKFSGMVRAELTDSNLWFTGGSAISAETSGSWQPKSNGQAGSAPANYGGTATTLLATANAALRNVQLDVLSDPTVLPANGSVFINLRVVFRKDSLSSFDYQVSGLTRLAGSRSLAGLATQGLTSQIALSTTAEAQRVIIPIAADFSFQLLARDDAKISLRGQMVASRTRPSVPKFKSIEIHDQVVTLRWEAATGWTYVLESSTNLSQWFSRAKDFTATANTIEWQTALTSKTEFFRLSGPR